MIWELPSDFEHTGGNGSQICVFHPQVSKQSSMHKLILNPQFSEPEKQEFSKNEWKCNLYSQNSCPSFGTEFQKTRP